MAIYIEEMPARWAIVDALGHVSYAGQVEEVELCGGKVLRVSIPGRAVAASVSWRGLTPGYEVPTWHVHLPLHALYRLVYVDEATARQKAANLPGPPGWEVPEIEEAPPPRAGMKLLLEGDEAPVRVLRVEDDRIVIDDATRLEAWFDLRAWPDLDGVAAVYSVEGKLLWGGDGDALPF